MEWPEERLGCSQGGEPSTGSRRGSPGRLIPNYMSLLHIKYESQLFIFMRSLKCFLRSEQRGISLRTGKRECKYAHPRQQPESITHVQGLQRPLINSTSSHLSLFRGGIKQKEWNQPAETATSWAHTIPGMAAHRAKPGQKFSRAFQSSTREKFSPSTETNSATPSHHREPARAKPGSCWASSSLGLIKHK